MKLVHGLKMLPRKSMYWSAGRFVSDRQYLKKESRDTAFEVYRRACYILRLIKITCDYKFCDHFSRNVEADLRQA